MIALGEVKLNGKRVSELGIQIDLERDEVWVRGEIIRPVSEPIYLMLNKPAGYVTTARDPEGRPSVLKLINVPLRVFPVGRLDRDSEGLLLLTNDGDLAHRLMHPRFKVSKIYQVLLNRPADEKVGKAFRSGVRIDESKPAKGELKFAGANRRFCQVTIWEGRNRQVRRMFSALGFRVKLLMRVQFGPLALGNLASGSWRYLRNKEVEQLIRSADFQKGLLSQSANASTLAQKPVGEACATRSLRS